MSNLLQHSSHMTSTSQSQENSDIPADLTSYALIYPQTMAWGHMDSFGHLNNVVYYRYAESARIDYLCQLGVFSDDYQMLLAHSSCTYLRPVFFPDTLLIGTSCKKLGNTSVVFEYGFYSQSQQAIVATAEAVMVRMNQQATDKQAWSDEERLMFAQIEKKVGRVID